ncbi:unnamed protein product, partial [Vitis vinifera]
MSVLINFPWFIINEGVHYSPLDGSDIQIKTSEEQDPCKNKEIKIESKLHNQLKKISGKKKEESLAMKGTFRRCCLQSLQNDPEQVPPQNYLHLVIFLTPHNCYSFLGRL